MNILNIWPTTAEGWVGFGVLVIGLISALVKLVPTWIEAHKLTIEAIRQKNIEKLKKVASAAMSGAQASLKSGAEKKEMVMSSIEAAGKQMGIEIDQAAWSELSKYIDEMKDYFNKMKESNERKEEE